MDIRCTTCGEQWEMDSLHELVSEGTAIDFDDARGMFYRDGCKAFGCTHGTVAAHPIIGDLAELMGDDMDGFASELDDLGYMGVI